MTKLKIKKLYRQEYYKRNLYKWVINLLGISKADNYYIHPATVDIYINDIYFRHVKGKTSGGNDYILSIPTELNDTVDVVLVDDRATFEYELIK